MLTALLWAVLNPARISSRCPEGQGWAYTARRDVFVVPGLLSEVRLSQGRHHDGDMTHRKGTLKAA